MIPIRLSSLLFVLLIAIVSCDQPVTKAGRIQITDCRADHLEPPIDLASHKPGDVEIYRVNYFDEGYEIIYYHDISGKLRDYHFYQIDSNTYDQGNYNWKNDSTLVIRIYNSETKQACNVELIPARDLNSSGWVRLMD